MTAFRAVGWFWLVAGLGIVAFLLTGTEPLTPREKAAMTSVSAPTPRGRCWLAPTRARKMDQSKEFRKTMAACALEAHGCVIDRSGEAYALEEPIVVECVADGHGRRTR